MEGIDINDNSLPSAAYLNLSGQYEFDLAGRLSGIRLFGVIDNVLDKDPPPVPGTIFMTDQQFYEVIGRSYRIGLVLDLK